MSDSPPFPHTPLAALLQKLPAKSEPPKEAKPVPLTKVSAKPVLSRSGTGFRGITMEQEDDSQLFLQAVQSVRPARHDKEEAADAGWLLRHAVELSALAPKGKAVPATPPKKGEKAHKGSNRRAVLPPSSGNALRDMADSVHAAEGSPLEEEAFFRAMREVQPLPGKGRDVAPAVEPAVNAAHVSNVLQDFMEGKLEFALSLTGEYLEGYVVGLDDLTMNKLRAGQYSPEAHLDLHGLNAMQAYQALVGFFRSAWYKGLRTVLVVPGRGRNSQDGVGILRDKLQFWLTQEPFKRVVLAFCTARPVDGGPGSVYVLLRKYRKKGKILWERLPADPDLF